MLRVRTLGTLGGLFLLACGGKAFVDGGVGAGGSAGAGGTTSSHTTSTHSTGSAGSGAPGDPCLEAQDWLGIKIVAALACDPTIYLAQCTGTATVYDYCGCELVANENNATAVQDAIDAYKAMVQMGCAPTTCAPCPGIINATCVPTGAGNTGTCASAQPL